MQIIIKYYPAIDIISHFFFLFSAKNYFLLQCSSEDISKSNTFLMVLYTYNMSVFFWLLYTPLIHINLIKNERRRRQNKYIAIRNILNSPFTAPLLPLFLVSLVKPWAWNSLFSTYWPTRPAVFLFFRFILFSSAFGFIWISEGLFEISVFRTRLSWNTKRFSFVSLWIYRKKKCYVVWAHRMFGVHFIHYIEKYI